MIQFVGIMVHGFQLVFYDDCDFPWQFSYYIGAHAVMFFILFSEFYIENYLRNRNKKVKDDSDINSNVASDAKALNGKAVLNGNRAVNRRKIA